MVVAIVLVGIALLVVLSFVKTGREAERAEASLAATAREFELATAGDSAWSGSVDGLEVLLVQGFSELDGSIELFSFSPPGDDGSRPGLEYLAVAAVTVPGAPADLAVGARQPLIRNTQKTGDAEFDRLFAVRAAPAATLAYLNAERRRILLERPVSWLATGRLVTRIGDPDVAVQNEHLRRLIAAARGLAGAGG